MKVKVQKFNPAKDAKPYYKTYDVPWKTNMTVLEALMYVYENHEPIAFDYSCRGRVCGRCSMMVNGKPAMACFTPIENGQDITVEPLRGYPVERDLIVDKTEMQDRISKLERRVRSTPMKAADIEKQYDVKVKQTLDDLEWCCRCLSCNAGCPVLNEMSNPEKYIGPAGMRAIALRYVDPNDEGDRVLEAVQNGLFNCILCGQCDQNCPASEIKHVEMFKTLRAEAEKRGLKP